MNEALNERTIVCPACWESFVIFLEPHSERDEQVIDCEICCRPAVVLAELGEVLSVEAES